MRALRPHGLTALASEPAGPVNAVEPEPRLGLSGALAGIGLAPVVRLLANVGLGGRLCIADGQWTAELWLNQGQVVAASFGDERGLPAVAAIGLALPTGQFRFETGVSPGPSDTSLARVDLGAQLAALDAERATVPVGIYSPAAVPRLTGGPGVWSEDDQFVLFDRVLLHVLLSIDGRRSIAELALGCGLARTIRGLAYLAMIGLVSIDPPRAASSPAAGSPTPALASGAEAGSLLALRRLLVGRFLSTVGNQFLLFAVPVLVFKITGSMSLSGTAFFVEWLVRLLSFPLSGALADRFGGRRVYLWADLVRGLACALAFLCIGLAPNQAYVVLVALGAVIGFCEEQAFVAMEANVPRLVAKDRLASAQSMLGMMDQGALLAGPALAGLLVGYIPISVLLLVAAVVFFVSLTNTFTMRAVDVATEPAPEHLAVIDELTAGFRTFAASRELVLMVLLTMLANLQLGILLASGPGITTGVFGKPESFYGLLSTLAGVAGVAVLLLVPWLKRWAPLPVVGLAAFAAMSLCSVLLAVAPSFWLFVGAYGAILSVEGLFNVYIRTERARIIPADRLGRTIAVIVLLNFSLLPVAGLLVSRFAEPVGPQRLILVVALGCAILAIPLFRPLLRIGRSTPMAHAIPDGSVVFP